MVVFGLVKRLFIFVYLLCLQKTEAGVSGVSGMHVTPSVCTTGPASVTVPPLAMGAETAGGTL